MAKNDKRLEKGEETYQRILAAAVELISQSGLKGLTAGKLSELSQVSKSNLFHHFKSTRGVPEAVLQMIFKELLRPIDAFEAKDLADFLENLGKSMLVISEDYRKICKVLFSFYNESLFDEGYRRALSEYLRASEITLSRRIKGYAKAPLTEQEAETYAALLLGTLDGFGIHILIAADEEVYLRGWRLQAGLICRALTP